MSKRREELNNIAALRERRRHRLERAVALERAESESARERIATALEALVYAVETAVAAHVVDTLPDDYTEDQLDDYLDRIEARRRRRGSR